MMFLEDVHGQNLKLLCTSCSISLLVLGRQVSFKSLILSPPLQYEVSITPSAHMVITVKSKGVIVDVLCELKSCVQTECARICLSLTGEVAFTSVYCELTPVLQNGGMCLLLIPAARFITCNSLTFPFFTLTFLNCRVWG